MRWWTLALAPAATAEVRWKATAPLLEPGRAGTFDETAVKDPSVTRHGERRHIFCYAWLFSTRNHRELAARKTTLAEFPSGWGAEEAVLAALHEAAHVYRVAGSPARYRLIYETQRNERRSNALAEARQLPGPWTVVDARFAAGEQLDFAAGGARWSGEGSHGELIRTGFDERMEVAADRVEFPIQGLTPDAHAAPYPALRWRLGLIAATPGKTAARPLFRDPVHDGAADPLVVWDSARSNWLMLYTNRRANLPQVNGVAWVHGTRIGIAESSDGGATWSYAGTAKIGYGPEEYTHRAPEVVEHAGVHHMFLSVVPGVFRDWNAGREIVHLTSHDLVNWKFEAKLDLGSDRIIDASVVRLRSGGWRMWYKDERAQGGSLHCADSPDLERWTPRGAAIAGEAGEGPKVFVWKERYWMVADVGDGLAVFRSEDAEHWERQASNTLREPGREETARWKGQHADVVVSGGRAYLFYFAHQAGQDAGGKEACWRRRSVIQVTELEYRDGWLECDRNRPARNALAAPRR